MMRANALAIATTAIWLTGCVVTPEPIPLFDGTPWSPSNDMDKVGDRDALSALDSGSAPPDSGLWGQPDSGPDASALDLLTPMDGLPDGLDDSTPPEGGVPVEGGLTTDTGSPVYDGLTGDVVLQE